jgi:hypothetical protein
MVYLSHILSYYIYIYIAKIHELNYINFLNSSTPTYQATSSRKKQKICGGRISPLVPSNFKEKKETKTKKQKICICQISPLNLCQAITSLRKKQKDSHLLNSNLLCQATSKRKKEKVKVKVKDLHLQNSTPLCQATSRRKFF